MNFTTHGSISETACRTPDRPGDNTGANRSFFLPVPSQKGSSFNGDITTGVVDLWGQRTNLDSTVLTNRCLYRDAMTT